MGDIITFYSYKGGTGRSMALANVAWILASNGKSVLVIDWDIEAPGLHRYFRPFLLDPDLTTSSSRGLMDFLHRFTVDAASPPMPRAEHSIELEAEGRSERRQDEWYRQHADILPFATSLEWDFEAGGTIDLVPAGRQGASYAPLVNSFNWPNFYERLGGGLLLDAVRLRLKNEYDYTLIDSRTGVSDTSGICTVLMPDTLVVCFTLNNQGIHGAAAVAESVAKQRRDEDGASNIRILPVPMRTDPFEKERLNRRRALARRMFEPWASDPAYWHDVELPYEAYYSYEETLSTFVDEPGSPRSMLSALERLSRHISGLADIALVPPLEDARQRVLRLFETPSDEHEPAPTQTTDGKTLLEAPPSPVPPPEIRRHTRRGLWGRLQGTLVGYDVYVCYARSDSAAYVHALEGLLASAGRSTFIEYEQLDWPGDRLPSAIRSRLRSSGLVLVICSPAAATSEHVAHEVAEAVSARKQVLIVNVDRSYARTRWGVGTELVTLNETGTALASGAPSPGIAESVLRRLGHQRARQSITRAASIMATMLVVAMAMAWLAFARARTAEALSQVALAKGLAAMAQVELDRNPRNLQLATLLLLESSRRHETPEATESLSNATRLLRPLLANADVGRIITTMTLAPDGKTIAVSGIDDDDRGFIGLWDSERLKPRWVHNETRPRAGLESDADQIDAIAWSPDGKKIAWVNRSSTIQILQAADGAPLTSLARGRRTTLLTFSPDGTWLAAAGTGDNSVTVWNCSSWSQVPAVSTVAEVLAIAFSPDGSTLAIAGPSGSGADPRGPGVVSLASTATWRVSQRIPVDGPPLRIAYATGGRIVTVTSNGITILDPASRRPPASVSANIDVSVISDSGRYVIGTNPMGDASVWDAVEGFAVGSLRVDRDVIRTAAFSPGEPAFATADFTGIVRLWSMRAGVRPIEQARLIHFDDPGASIPTGGPTHLSFDSTGRYLLTGSPDGRLRRWRVDSNQVQFEANEPVRYLAIDPQGSHLVASTRTGVEAWSLNGGPRPSSLPLPEAAEISFSADGQWLATASMEDNITVFRAATREPVFSVKGSSFALGRDDIIVADREKLTRFSLSSRSSIEGIIAQDRIYALARAHNLVAGVVSEDIVIWDDRAGKLVEQARIQHRRPIVNLISNPGGTLLAGFDVERSVGIWTNTGELRHELTSGTSALAFDRTGTIVAIADREAGVSFWSAVTGTQFARFDQGLQVAAIAFAAAGRDLLYIASGTSIVGTPYTLSDLQAEACARVTRTLTVAEWRRFVGDGEPISACSSR